MSATAELLVESAPHDLREMAGLYAASYAGAWISVDAVPDLYETRQVADIKSQAVFEDRMDSLREGDNAMVPYEVDAVSAADLVLAAREQYGERSQQYQETYNNLVVNCGRFFGEAYRKNTYEYFAPLAQPYSADHNDYLAGGIFPVMDMARNGITPLAEDFEQPRRLLEYRELATSTRIGQLLLQGAGVELAGSAEKAAKVSVRTISQCPDEIKDRYEQDKAAGIQRNYYGYAPQVDKLMIRDTSYDTENGVCYVEQIGIPGTYITPDVIETALQITGVIEEGQTVTKNDVLGMQIIATDGQGVLGVMPLLDSLASARSGKNIFMGEEVAANHPKDYAFIPFEAEERREQQSLDAIALAEYLLELSESGIDHWQANRHIEHFAKERIFHSVKYDAKRAGDAFDETMAREAGELSVLRDSEDYDELARREALALENAPSVETCGAGSCGLEEAERDSLEMSAARELGLNVENGVIVDRVRKCPKKDCGEVGGIVYTPSRKKPGEYDKACTKCGATEFK